MKHYDADSKKFIKNVVSLAVSALLLAAATFAWFASSHESVVNKVSAMREPTTQMTYFHLPLSNTATFLDGDASALTVRDRSGTETSTAIANYLTDGNLSWTSSSPTTNDWDINSMYPGEYGAYKICYNSDGTARKLTFSTVACASEPAQRSICVYALARKKGANESDWSTVASTTTTLYTLMSGGNTSFDVLNIASANGVTIAVGDMVEVFYVIGMPASDFASQHSALQANGATVTIQTVDVVAATSS